LDFSGTSISFWAALFILTTGFIATFIDSIVGGGGLISLPALLALNIPPQMALGTNKLASSVGAAVSAGTFWKAGKVDRALVIKLAPLSLTASVMGAWTVSHMPPVMLQPLILLFLCAVTVSVIRRHEWGAVSTYRKEKKGKLVFMALMAFLIAFGDGFMGPGTGTFLLFCFLSAGFDFVTAAGNSRVLNLISNAGALATFLIHGNVLFLYGLIMAAGMAAGGYFGSRTAISRGNAFVRILFIGITTILLLKVGIGWIIKGWN
jgi:uncharacterized membrane protein YfcA